MSDCLVTKLKGAVNDDSIGHMGDLHIPFTLLYSTEEFSYMSLRTDSGFTVIIEGDGNLVGSDGTVYGKKHTYPAGEQIVRISGTVTNAILRAGYGVTKFNAQDIPIRCRAILPISEVTKYQNMTYFRSRKSYSLTFSGNLSDVCAFKKLSTLYIQDSDVITGSIADISQLYGTITDLYIQNCEHITGDIADLKSFSKLSALILTYSKGFYGDASLLPASLFDVTVDKRCKFTWENTRPSSSNILRVSTMNLGSYVDAALINLSNCKDIAVSPKTISMVGTRTSASDAAVAKLQSMGWTVTVTEA